MTDLDLKRELGDLLVGEPAVGPDPVRALRAGRRAHVRRRYASSAIGLAVVVVLAAAVPIGLSLVPTGGTSPELRPGASTSGSEEPSPVPESAAPSPTPSAVPTPEPSVGVSSSPTPAATPSPTPSASAGATGTVEPDPSPTPSLSPTPETAILPSAVPCTDGVTGPGSAATGWPCP